MAPGSIPPAAWFLLAINTVWSVIYDTLYAMVDREDDLAVGIKSTAILFGRFDVAVTGVDRVDGQLGIARGLSFFGQPFDDHRRGDGLVFAARS